MNMVIGEEEKSLVWDTFVFFHYWLSMEHFWTFPLIVTPLHEILISEICCIYISVLYVYIKKSKIFFAFSQNQIVTTFEDNIIPVESAQFDIFRERFLICPIRFWICILNFGYVEHSSLSIQLY